MKKLIPALCMLLVAACLMGTSTYAWFAAGTTVEATGMAIEATSSGGLAIAVPATKNAVLTAAKFASTSVDLTEGGWNNGATKVAPTSTGDGNVWYSAVADAADSYEADGSYSTVCSTATTSNDNEGAGNFYHTQLYVKTLNMDAQGVDTDDTDGIELNGKTVSLFVQSVEVSGGGTNELKAALRVAFVLDGQIVVFAPYQTTSSYVGNHVSNNAKEADSKYDGFIASGTTATVGGVEVTTATGNVTTAYLGELTYGDTQYAKVNMFIYYEGEDESCMSVNAINLAEVNVTVTFGANQTAAVKP